MHPRAVHTAARITGRDPGQNEYHGRNDKLSHFTLLGTVGVVISTRICPYDR
jgi:hypothetical protein